MAFPSEDAFARLFRSLDAPERTAFVAELWAGRGWETRIDGDDVVVSRDGEQRRIRVVDTGWFGTPTLEDADSLATARDRDAVRRAAEDAGVRYVPPPVLYEQLRYAVDRETAATLFESTFGRPLDAPGPHARPPVRDRLEAFLAETWQTTRSAFGESRLALSVLLVLVLVGVVVAGPVLPPSEGDMPQVAEPATVGTAGAGAGAGALGESSGSSESVTDGTDSGEFPPGVDGTGIDDFSTLLAAHEQGVLSRQRTLHVAARGPPNATFMDSRVAWNYTLRVQRTSHYRFDANYTYPPGMLSRNDSSVDSVRVSVYAEGGSNYRRRTTPVSTSYQRYPTEAAGGAWVFTSEVRRYLQFFLGDGSASVDCSGPNAGDVGTGTVGDPDAESCRIVVTGPPSTLANAEGYRATATVTREGVVRSLSVRYTLPDRDGDGERESVRFWLAYESMDTTTVSEPAWLPDAKNATDQSSSA